MLRERGFGALQSWVYVVHPLGEGVPLEFAGKDMKVDVGYGLPCSPSVLEGRG